MMPLGNSRSAGPLTKANLPSGPSASTSRVSRGRSLSHATLESRVRIDYPSGATANKETGTRSKIKARMPTFRQMWTEAQAKAKAQTESKADVKAMRVTLALRVTFPMCTDLKLPRRDASLFPPFVEVAKTTMRGLKNVELRVEFLNAYLFEKHLGHCGIV